ncbi:GTP-binding protein HSR1-related protein [Pirellula staleyi DSM 6068]|uniref:GTP-binding protein HSR1-related protein n=1 Tax=Pirellula staleyi (strain ATCC 27377 / DSM 6068 / ICPB 4128) TaxID=530564 RepID=D2QWW7_PIRSD|nr:GTP-binding protein HSR1-related protein [Pirellula staleyi DSM 6068]
MQPIVAETEDSYRDAMNAVERALERFKNSSDVEKEKLRQELAGLRAMHDKMQCGRVEIVVFGEISVGKSALINALIGRDVAAVDVRGGWTKEVWQVAWDGAGYCLPGLGVSQVVLVDTPGINEVGGSTRGERAREAAQRADLLLFVTDSDFNEVEHDSLSSLVTFHKPIIVVLSKSDLYSPDQKARLLHVLTQERLVGLVPAEHVVTAAADPREREYIIESADGSVRSEWRKPQPDVSELRAKILEMLDREGLAIVALNAALFAADKTDRLASLRVRLRNERASQVVWSYATLKAIAVGLNPIAVADVFGGAAVDVAMIVTLAAVYNLELSWTHARQLALSIGKAAGFMTAGVLLTTLATSAFKALTIGKGTLLTALPQGAAAGYGSYIVGEAARYYFEHGSSWGGEGPKKVVEQILARTDKDSVVQKLREEIRKRLLTNPHSGNDDVLKS